MVSRLIVGTQFGDEGKGKLTDFFGENTDLVVRYQGGNNAGHTVCFGEEEFKLHLLPSGVIQKKRSLIGAGVVIDPTVLLEEVKGIKERLGFVNLGIDPRAHVIMPYHVLLDQSIEGEKGVIGTTRRGIGPCYADRASRVGIRIEDLIDEERLKEKLYKVYDIKEKILRGVYDNKEMIDKEKIFKEYSELGKKIKEYVTDVSLESNNALKEGKGILFEGAQGAFLDNDFGTYPFVTSSHPISGGVFIGVGLGARKIDTVTGIVKAYTTRVGEGPFPTELSGKEADELRKAGNEFGTTTGRPRRVGWLDLVLIKTAHRLNNLTEIALTKLDVLSGIDSLKICIAYKVGEKEFEEVPALTKDFEQAKPIYKEFKPFKITGKEKSFNALSKEAQDYIGFIETQTGIPIKLISIGPKREETILK